MFDIMSAALSVVGCMHGYVDRKLRGLTSRSDTWAMKDAVMEGSGLI